MIMACDVRAVWLSAAGLRQGWPWSGGAEPVVAAARFGHAAWCRKRALDGEGVGRGPVLAQAGKAVLCVGHRGSYARRDPPGDRVRVAQPGEPFAAPAHDLGVEPAEDKLGQRVE